MQPNRTSWLLLFFLALSSVACTLDEGKKIVIEELSLSTTDDAEIFFKNLRQSAYKREEVDRMVSFKNKKYLDAEDSIEFQVKMVWSWYNDKAFILLDTEATTEDTIKLQFSNKSMDLYVSESSNARDQTVAAATIYNALIDNETIIYSFDTSIDTLFKINISKEAFRVTMSDYFRLTNNF